MMKRLMAAMALVMLSAAACGTSDGATVDTPSAQTASDPASVDGDDDESVDRPAPAADEAPPPADEAPPPAAEAAGSAVVDPDPDAPAMAGASPIGAFFEAGGGFDAALAEYTVRVEEFLVGCMAAQGFEFKRTSPEVAEIERLQSELTVLEWTSRFGYGVSTSFDSVVAQQTADPNNEILFSLSPAERSLWILTLTGQDGQSPLGGGEAPPLEEQGCIGEAIVATGGGSVIEGLDEFSGAYEEAEAAMFDRREMVDVVDAWSRCMSEAGYPNIADRDDGEALILERFETIVAPLQAALEEIEPEEGRALIEGDTADLERLPGLDVEGLRTLQRDEVELALTDLACYDEHVKAVYEPLRDELERGLLTEFDTELDALRNLGG